MAKVNWEAVREGASTYSFRNRATRFIWRIVWFALASWTPPAWTPWRRLWLRIFGAQISSKAFVRGSVKIWMPSNLVLDDFASLGPEVTVYNVAPVHVGAYAVVSQRAVLCTAGHDIDDGDFPLVQAPIWIGKDAWIATEAFVGQGVTVGARAVLGARAVTFYDLEPGGVYVGNPCALKRKRVNGDG
jgi:putative colanic acid biosynthesis acetyltransferase WcaF